MECILPAWPPPEPSSAGVRPGIQLPEVERRVGWREYVRLAQAAEAAGFDSIWLGDHLLYAPEFTGRGTGTGGGP